MLNHLYILDEHHNAVPCPDALVWGRWMKSETLHVKHEEIGPYWVSTVFLGFDPNLREDLPPRLFETMVFLSGTHDGGGMTVQERYSTWEEALEGHNVIAAKMRTAAAG